MTEPIKLPPLPRPPIHLSNWTNELCEWAKDYARLAVEQATAELRAEVERLRADYGNACKTVAQMHAAATGRPGEGPRLGVVEDMAAMHAEVERLRANRDFWHQACLQAQEHRDGANASNAAWEAETVKLRAECERLRALIRLDDAEWRDKHIHSCGGESFQSWLVSVYLPVPLSEQDKSPEAALERALKEPK
jgi:hypothetical protein